MEVIGVLAGAVVFLMLAAVLTVAAARRRRAARPVPRSEMYKQRFALTGDPEDLQRAVQAALDEEREDRL